MFESIFKKYPFFRSIPAILCMALIFKLSSMTGDDLKGFPHVWDKLAHTVEYATLCGTYCLWWSRSEWSRRKWLRVLVVVALTLAYGCTDEYHQRFVEGRSCDALDLVADTFGGIIGGTVYAFICKLLDRFDPVPEANIKDEAESDETC